MSKLALDLAKQLIAIASVSPNDGGCQQILQQHLQQLGFSCQTMIYGPDDRQVTNLWAIKKGSAENAKTFLYAGHTDVVPPGPLEQWRFDPFTPTVADGNLYGRGTSDMKTANAVFIAALSQYLAANPDHQHNIALLITSDEESDAIYGTKAVCADFKQRGIGADWCIIGEASAQNQIGDMVKNGRRGSLNGIVTVTGTQSHIAYCRPQDNPIYCCLAAFDEIAKTCWDNGDEYFQPTSLHFSNLNAGAGAANVTPAQVEAWFNFRFSPQSTPQSLKQRVIDILEKHQLNYSVQWHLSGMPFITPKGDLLDAVTQAVYDCTGLTPELSTSGGTSDGRFIAEICPQVVEVGPPNTTIHKINEHILLEDIDKLEQIYLRLLELLVSR